jgi:hypothetical protein
MEPKEGSTGTSRNANQREVLVGRLLYCSESLEILMSGKFYARYIWANRMQKNIMLKMYKILEIQIL